jgi:predicted acyl esterase
VPALPQIRLEVRESRDVVRSVRDEPNWPLDGTEWRALYLTGDGLAGAPPADDGLFAGVEKWRGRSYVPFEGSYGFGRDRITTGWLKASLRALDPGESRPFEPVPACTSPEPLAPGQVVAADIALGPSATFFRAGDTLRQARLLIPVIGEQETPRARSG